MGEAVLDRVTVSALLKGVIAILSACIVAVLALGALDSWHRLASTKRTMAVAEISGHLFTALHSLRVDRASSYRDLLADKALTAINPLVRAAREAEMPAMRAALSVMESTDFPERTTALASLGQAVTKLAALQEESAAAFLRPKADRRSGLAQEYFDAANGLLEMLDKLSSRLVAWTKLDDAFIDQLMQLKQLAWMTRNSGGDASVLVSNTLAGQPLPNDALAKYHTNVGKLEAAWTALEDVAAGLPLPVRFTEALQKAKREYFAPDYLALRTNTLNALVAGKPVEIKAADWAPMSVGKLATLLGVAEAALDVAKEHAARQRANATQTLALQLALLAVAGLLAAGMVVVVSRRVTGPLKKIQASMRQLAGGDLSTEVAFLGRKDEIGALAGAMEVFKNSLIETDRLRTEQKEADARAALARTDEMQRLADEFQGALGNIVDTVSSASTELEAAAGTLTRTADETQRLSAVVASASEEASANVQSVAGATQEMTSSVDEIARQVQESSRITAEAVQQANKTDARITELSNAASRIGDVVKLITAIAEQTNLLALNATIEAARAGEAGRGFAVVAQEVKALAAQTAKATDEIGTQISSMQSATQDSVASIKEISGTISRVSEIAAAIAAAVEEQGATTQEIFRNVQHAANGTAEVAGNITNVNRGASETGAASGQVLASAQSLARESAKLKVEVEKFVSRVRAA